MAPGFRLNDNPIASSLCARLDSCEIEYTGRTAARAAAAFQVRSGWCKVRGMQRTALAALALSCTTAMPDADPIPDPPPAGPSCADDSVLCEVSPGGAEGGTTPVSCCETLWVIGDAFPMGFSVNELGDAVTTTSARHRDHQVRVSSFFLDRFEITRARFLEFAARYDGPPPAGSGAHPRIEGRAGSPIGIQS